MTRIAFITLFLGLTLSDQKVEVNVSGPAASVELVLDGQRVASLAKPPWIASVDFGERLVPRRLVARALNAGGEEIARTEQKINLPHAAAETSIVLERNDAGMPRAARLLWHSLDGEEPKRVELLLDSRVIPVGRDLRATLPPIDDAQPHLLRARLTSKLGVFTDSEVAFGGGLEDATAAELTAVVVRLKDPRQKLEAAEVERWLTVRGTTPAVVAIEESGGEVIVVRHPIETETAMRLDAAGHEARRRSAVTGSMASVTGMLGSKTNVMRFVWPLVIPKGKADLFPPSRTFGFSTADDFKRVISDIGYPGSPPQLRYADAVAVAGIQALGGRRPRAVVLILGDNINDASRMKPAQVREYLAASGVPLYVWSLASSEAAERWGSDVHDIAALHGFTAAFDALRADLDSQRVIWIRGDFLPGEVTLNEEGSRVIASLIAPDSSPSRR